MGYKIRLMAFFGCVVGCSLAFASEDINNRKEYLSWQSLPDLPESLGVAGVFIGVHNDVLIVAGGANSSEPVWQNDKQWHDKVWVLEKINAAGKQSEFSYKWIDAGALDFPVAYGGVVSTEQGVICIGGCDSKQVFNKVFCLKWDPVARKIKKSNLPSLPESCSYTSVAKIGDTIYVAGGQRDLTLDTTMNNFWSLDLSKNGTDECQWKELPTWPGPSRALNLTVAQHNGITNCVYVISGREIEEGADYSEAEFLTDVYEFNPQKAVSDEEETLQPWRKRSDIPVCVMAGTGVDIGQSHIFVLGGVDGSTSKGIQMEFPKKAWAYHTITDTWIDAGRTPANQITTVPVKWGDSVIIAGGEVGLHVRSPKIWKIDPIKVKKAFGVINFTTLVVYLLSMIGVGLFFSSRNKNTDDFFRGGQRINWVVAALSIFATMLSSITFMAVPAMAYATNWVLAFLTLPMILIAPFVIKTILPFFRKIDAVSAYEYLEKRFNVSVRLFASASFTLFQIGRMAIVLYLPALALSAITPMNEVQCVLMMGAISTIYCTMGGIEAVVWTDAIQTVILMGAALLSLVLIVCHIDGGLGQFFTLAVQEQKLHSINWDWSLSSYATTAFWVIILGGLGQSLIPFSSDQAVVQRYMVTSTEKKAAKAIWTNTLIAFASVFLFFGLGSALFVFYKMNPQQLDPTFKTDAIFPLFIARQLPIGVAGLVVAGIFAAAQSTLSTSLNSVSSTITDDFIRRFNVLKSEQSYLRTARVLTALFGCVGTGVAIFLVLSDIRTVWEVFIEVLGLFGGSMCGLFFLGIFSKRTTGLGALTGAVLGMVGLFAVQHYTGVSGMLYAFIGISFCCILGYTASLIFPKNNKPIDGLTIYSVRLYMAEKDN